jgi:hypothetical protein
MPLSAGRISRVHVSFCAGFFGLENVNRRCFGVSVKMGGMQVCREAIAEKICLGGLVMDGNVEALKEKLERLMREAAETAADLQIAERGRRGPVHFSQIEAAAHAVGCALSSGIQERVVREAVSDVPAKLPCPDCGALCKVKFDRRTIQSTDGPVVVLEPECHCRRCRRDFFPSARNTGA